MGVLEKFTFYSDDELNEFLKSKRDNCYIVKMIIYGNPATRKTEYHMLVSYNAEMKGGEHIRKGVQCNGRKETP